MVRVPFRRRFLMWAIRHLSLYPPYLGAGIRVTTSDPAGGVFRVRMKLTRLNRNVPGTHFGGSLYSMCDPFYGLILMDQLGPEYRVWDTRAEIDFVRPGKSTVYAEFRISDHEVAEIRARADAGEVVRPSFETGVTHEDGEVVAKVKKDLYVRRRRA